MGLDMYLFKRQKKMDEVAYWRKANQIREWIANRCEDKFKDNDITPLTKEDLEALVADCKKVLNNHKLASKLLPTSTGFFFGSQEYDDWYYGDLKDTVEMVTKVIDETDWDNEEIVYYEWY